METFIPLSVLDTLVAYARVLQNATLVASCDSEVPYIRGFIDMPVMERVVVHVRYNGGHEEYCVINPVDCMVIRDWTWAPEPDYLREEVRRAATQHLTAQLLDHDRLANSIAAIIRAVRAGNSGKVQAIRLFMELTGPGLLRAKEALEEHL